MVDNAYLVADLESVCFSTEICYEFERSLRDNVFVDTYSNRIIIVTAINEACYDAFIPWGKRRVMPYKPHSVANFEFSHILMF